MWRWRGNPLCRRTDRREAWVALWAALTMLLGAPLAGWCTAEVTREALVKTAHEQRAERQRVWATAEEIVILPPADTDPESATPEDRRSRVIARWAGPDGNVHKGAVRAGRDVQPGDRFMIWTDKRGKATSRPVSVRTAGAHAMLAGVAAAASAAALVEGARRLAVRGILRRRYAEWAAEWRRIGPDWGRTGTGN
nr:hypothetical protein [Streptomyces sp. HNM0574]